MRRFRAGGIIFTCILLMALVTGCGEQDTLEEQKITTKGGNTISDKNIKPKAREQRKQLPKIVLLTTTQACHCVLDRCSKAEEIINEFVQRFPKKLIFKKLDHAREQELVKQLVREYKIHYLPALLFFDKKGVFNGALVGFLHKGGIEKKLKEIGIE